MPFWNHRAFLYFVPLWSRRGPSWVSTMTRAHRRRWWDCCWRCGACYISGCCFVRYRSPKFILPQGTSANICAPSHLVSYLVMLPVDQGGGRNTCCDPSFLFLFCGSFLFFVSALVFSSVGCSAWTWTTVRIIVVHLWDAAVSVSSSRSLSSFHSHPHFLIGST